MWLLSGDWLLPVRQTRSLELLTRVAYRTDPPYYDNIGYSDLSDFFYVWLRRSLRGVYPGAPRARCSSRRPRNSSPTPYRHDGKDGAREFFEDGFRACVRSCPRNALADFPITVYYAFKQSDADEDGTASTGWETLLDGMIRSGWAITATWPMRSELGNRMRDSRHERPRLLDRPRAAPAPRRRADDRSARPDRRAPRRAARCAAQAPAGRDRAGRSAAGGDRPWDGGVLALREGDRERRHDDDRALGARADQRDPRPGAQRAGGRLRRRDPLRDRLVSPARVRDGQVRGRGRPRAGPQHGGRDDGPRRHPHERRRQGHAAVAGRPCPRATTSSPTIASAPGRCCTT